MQLTDKTLAILKNFYGYNQCIRIEQGNIIKTTDQDGEVFAVAQVEEEFPVGFSIYDLQRLLNVIGLFDKPQIDYNDVRNDIVVLKIGDGKAKVRYASADPMLCVTADYTKDYPVETELAKFKITHAQITQLLKAASILGASDISFIAEAGKVYMVAHNLEKPSNDQFKVEVAESEQSFNVNFNIKTWKFLPDDYEVVIDEADKSVFKGNFVTYTVGCEVLVG